MNYDANFCGGGFMWFMWIFWILIIVGVLFVLQYVIKKKPQGSDDNETPMRILKNCSGTVILVT
tara:strand:- start:503 stop:694 length:192 start_codon:yes stop_codon:yes gene_type:complete